MLDRCWRELIECTRINEQEEGEGEKGWTWTCMEVTNRPIEH